MHTQEAYSPTGQVFNMGLVILFLSLFLFCLPFLFQVEEGLFLINILLTALYFIILLVAGKLRKGRNGIYAMFVFLTLFLISAYALNREMDVFKTSVTWLSVLLTIACTNLILFSYGKNIPRPVLYGMSFIAGLSFFLFGYLAIYLVPLYGLSVIAGIFLGISLHTFVPLLFCIYILVFIHKQKKVNRKYSYYFRAGITSALILFLSYTFVWNAHLRALHTIRDNDLPGWVAKARKSKPDNITEKILKTGLAYSVPADDLSDFLWSTPRMGIFGEMKHDPLVMTAALFAGKPKIEPDDRIRILNTIYDVRYNAEERYWSGDNLATTDVNSRIEIWPDMRLSYTEMVLDVLHQKNRNSWSRQQEAIYTFQLPEGSVVTSLSLWIEGKEEKAVLTTKSKAAEAYKTIVGVEVRDPSVVHWQEGNRVSVRVFPVVAGESRRFKIGITSPLLVSGKQLLYQPAYFTGPPATHAEETTQVHFSGQPGSIRTPAGFKKTANGLERKGRYAADWQLAMSKTEVIPSAFTFNDTTYRLQPVGNTSETADIQNVYLDINAAWTQKEFNRMLRLLKGKSVFVASEDQQIITLTEENQSDLFTTLSENRFSLFPFHKIKEHKQSLVITKTNALSPTLDDIKDADMVRMLKKSFSDGHRIRLFNIGTELTPYLKTLKEFRTFYYAHGDISHLHALISSGRFPEPREANNQVIIEAADIMIEASPVPAEKATAPDHLMRLFVYNNILKKNGTALLTDGELEAQILEEAQTAYVVTPVSSLIVLETQKDYDRFNIEDSKSSLKNAALHSKGAVPEPHEWALIIMVGLLLVYLKWKNKLALKTGR